MSFLIFWKFKGSLATAYPLSSFHKWILEVLEKRTCEKQLMTIPMPTVRKPISIKLRRENNAFWKLKKTLYSKMHNTTLFSSHYYSLFVSLRLTSKGVIMPWFFSPCILIQIRFCTTLTTNGQISLELSKLGKLKICIVQGSKAQVSFCCPFVIFSYCILSSLEPLGQLQPNLAQSFQFILFFLKNEGPDPFKRRDNYQRWEDIEITIIYRLMLF